MKCQLTLEITQNVPFNTIFIVALRGKETKIISDFMYNIVLRHEVYMIYKKHIVLEIRYIIFKMDISAGDDLYLNIGCPGFFPPNLLEAGDNYQFFSVDLSSLSGHFDRKFGCRCVNSLLNSVLYIGRLAEILISN